MKKRLKGVTFIELLAASVILSIVIVAATMLYISNRKLLAKNVRHYTAERIARRVLERCSTSNSRKNVLNMLNDSLNINPVGYDYNKEVYWDSLDVKNVFVDKIDQDYTLRFDFRKVEVPDEHDPSAFDKPSVMFLSATVNWEYNGEKDSLIISTFTK